MFGGFVYIFGNSMNEKNIWMLSGELGFLIALPLVVASVVGVNMDKAWGTMPVFTLVGMFLAAAFSTAVIIRKLKKL